PDLPLISAFAAWGGEGNGANAGVESNGTRVKVGVIDTGIDITNPCFNDAGYSATQGFPQGPPSLTNNKVIVAKVFYNKAKNQSLGGVHKSGTLGVQDLLTTAVDDLDQAGMISAIAAGNSGPGHQTVESPGSAARGLTAGAFTVGHFIGAPVTAGGHTYGAAT